MEYVMLGRTGLRVSVAGLGCGGFSRLGLGTGDPAHLRTNIASLLAPPLPEADRARLTSLFGHLVGVGLDAPHLARRARA